MGNRFSTITQYHSLVTGHGVLAAITFLFLVPIAVMFARFHPDRRRGRRIHAYLQILSVGLSTVVFILGFFAVGPSRSLTNPHHGIGVAIYVLILTQAIGGSWVRKIFKKSLRLMIHRWFGAIVGILGVVQIPLGLTLYGSPKFTFILYALWMAFLIFLYFILSWRHENDWDDNMTMYGGRSYGGRSESGVTHSERKSGRGFGWLGPLAAVLGVWALLRGRKRRDDGDRSNSGSESRSGRTPEVIPSRRGSTSYYMTNDKYSERTDHQGGGLMNKLLAVGGVVGAGALFKKFAGRKDDRRYDEEYSAVATDTPSRFGPPRTRPPRKRQDDYTESEFTEDRTELAARPRTPLLPGPGGPAASSVVGPRPVTPRASHARTAASGLDSNIYSDYSSYVSPSRRTREDERPSGAGKGLLAGLGLGWFAKKLKDRRDKRAEEERLRLEETGEMGDTVPGIQGMGMEHQLDHHDIGRRLVGQPPPSCQKTQNHPTLKHGHLAPLSVAHLCHHLQPAMRRLRLFQFQARTPGLDRDLGTIQNMSLCHQCRQILKGCYIPYIQPQRTSQTCPEADGHSDEILRADVGIVKRQVVQQPVVQPG